MPPFDFDVNLHSHVLNVWGRDVTYQPVKSQPAAAAFQVTAVFERHHEIVMDEIARSELNSAGHSTSAPVLSVRLSDFAAVPKSGDKATIGAEVFLVWDVQPDGQGWADLVLREVSA